MGVPENKWLAQRREITWDWVGQDCEKNPLQE